MAARGGGETIMIIAAYAGCGKTTFAEKTWNSVDLVCVPYKYLVTDDIEEKEAEEGKACYGYDLNPTWPGNYISAVLMAYHRYQYVVIPTVLPVLEELRRLRIPYILCYPERSLKEEYRTRYRIRGNSDAFEEVFVGNWDFFLDQFVSDEYGKHIRLRAGEFLLDHRKQITDIVKETETVVPLQMDDLLEDDVQQIFEETGVCIEEQYRQFMIFVAEHEELLEQWKKEGMIVFPDDYELARIIKR